MDSISSPPCRVANQRADRAADGAAVGDLAFLQPVRPDQEVQLRAPIVIV
jgi:hypothetical protein